MICRLILPEWARHKNPGLKKVLEGVFTSSDLRKYNQTGYGIYYLPNYPSQYDGSTTVDGSHIDTFNWVFVDCDLKDDKYTKDSFIEMLSEIDIQPTKVIDSGNGCHAYWQVAGLDAMSYLRFQRRLMALYQTDDAIGQLFQLMRLPGYKNTKREETQPFCDLLFESDTFYTAEELDKLLPPITVEDEAYCQQHYDKTYGLNQKDYQINDTLPARFGKLLKDNQEVKELWAGATDDRSKNDYRLGHLMFADGFSKDEALSVLINSVKAMQRAPIHRQSYAVNIVDKIWTYEEAKDKDTVGLSQSVLEILSKGPEAVNGTRLRCWEYVDNTEAGFRLGHVMGLVAGSGVGKTALALNIFLGFVKFNPDYVHFFVPLEQPGREIALRWQAMCGSDTSLHSKVQILSNYDDEGTFRDLSLTEIKEHILDFTSKTGKKVGCVVLDHIGVLCNNNKHGQDEGVKEIAKAMKGFAEETQTFLIMQSQTARSKAGIGDLELDKDAAFGTSVFENFCDYMVVLWQPLKRMYQMGAPTIMAFKFCKIRHKKQGKDVIMEDVPYSVHFDPESQLVRPITQDEEKAIPYWIGQATSKRKADRKSELVEYTSVRWEKS